MRVKLDEDLSLTAATPLADAGHTILTVRSQGWTGTKDPALWPMIVREGVFLVTADKGFGDVRLYPPGSHPGVLVVRPSRESTSAYRRLLAHVIGLGPLEDLVGCVAVVNEGGFASAGRLRLSRV